MLRWTFLLVIPLFIFTGCGDLEPDMQDTRTVILNMDFDQRSSTRTSSVSATELSNYKTHLIMVLTSGENLSNSSYWNYKSNLGEHVLYDSDRKITLNMKLNTEMKIFAFLFRENYRHDDLFSAKPEAGYYGESQSFTIGSQTDSLEANIRLTQVSGTDNTAPTASVTIDTITTSGNAVVKSTETGTAYLVNTAIIVSNLDSITGAADNQWNSVAISLANTDTNLPATGLADGTYNVYAVDVAGNLSSASSNSVIVATTATTTMDPSLEAFYPFNGDANDESGNSYHGQLGDNVNTSTFPTLTDDRYGNTEKAYSFDGDDYIALKKYVTYNSISEITVCAWVSSTDNTSKKFIISFDRSESYRLALNDSGNKYVGWDTTDSANNTNDLRTSDSYEDGNWHHICGWYNSSSTEDKKIFVDGEKEVSDNNSHSGRNLGTSLRTKTYGFIGWGSEASSFDGNGNFHQSDFMKGEIDDVRIYSRSLSDEEIRALYLSEKP